MTTDKLKQLRIEYKDNQEMRVKIDILLLSRIGEKELSKFWHTNNL